MRIRRQAATGVAVLLPETVELVGAEAALEEGARVDTGGGVALNEHLVAAPGMGLAPEEVVEPHLVERRGGGVGGDVSAHSDPWPLGPVHHDRGVPPDPPAVAPFDLLVTGEPRLHLGRDGVDVVGRGQRRDCHPLLAGPLEHAQHQVAGPGRPGPGQQVVEGLQPFRGLFGVDIG